MIDNNLTSPAWWCRNSVLEGCWTDEVQSNCLILRVRRKKDRPADKWRQIKAVAWTKCLHIYHVSQARTHNCTHAHKYIRLIIISRRSRSDSIWISSFVFTFANYYIKAETWKLDIWTSICPCDCVYICPYALFRVLIYLRKNVMLFGVCPYVRAVGVCALFSAWQQFDVLIAK